MVSINHGRDGEIVTPDHNSSESVITVCPVNELQIKDYEEQRDKSHRLGSIMGDRVSDLRIIGKGFFFFFFKCTFQTMPRNARVWGALREATLKHPRLCLMRSHWNCHRFFGKRCEFNGRAGIIPSKLCWGQRGLHLIWATRVIPWTDTFLDHYFLKSTQRWWRGKREIK